MGEKSRDLINYSCWEMGGGFFVQFASLACAEEQINLIHEG